MSCCAGISCTCGSVPAGLKMKCVAMVNRFWLINKFHFQTNMVDVNTGEPLKYYTIETDRLGIDPLICCSACRKRFVSECPFFWIKRTQFGENAGTVHCTKFVCEKCRHELYQAKPCVSCFPRWAHREFFHPIRQECNPRTRKTKRALQ